MKSGSPPESAPKQSAVERGAAVFVAGVFSARDFGVFRFAFVGRDCFDVVEVGAAVVPPRDGADSAVAPTAEGAARVSSRCCLSKLGLNLSSHTL